MYKKIGLTSLLLFIMFFLGVNGYLAQAQGLGASLSDAKGRPGKQVVIDLTLSDNTTVSLGGINILFNPNVANIEDVSIDVIPGPAMEGTDHIFIPAVKNDTTMQDPVNTRDVFIGIFPKVFPPPVIPNGVIATIIFTIENNAKPGDFTDLIFSFIRFNPTSFADQNGNTVIIDQLDFTRGLITVRSRSSGSSSCALAQGDVTTNSLLIGVLLILLIPLSIVGLRRLRRIGGGN